MYKNGNIILQKDYKNIIDSVKFFNFNASFLGETFTNYKIYASGLMKMNESNEKNKNNYKEKITYYIIMLLTFLHEIIDHVLDNLHLNLFDSNINSSEAKDLMNSKSANKRGYESGEDLHVKLFWKIIKRIKFRRSLLYFGYKKLSRKKL